METLTPTDDGEAIAAHENRLAWRRRAIMMMVTVFVVAPLVALVIWVPGPHAPPTPGISFPGPAEPVLQYAYEAYIRDEGPSRRGEKFGQCAVRLAERQADFPTIAIPESELFFYLGQPDLVQLGPNGSVGAYAYVHDGSGKKDAAVIVTMVPTASGRQVRQIGFTAPNMLSGFVPYHPTTTPSSATKPMDGRDNS